MAASSTFTNYWKRKKLLGDSVPRFAIKNWVASDTLCEIEQVYFESLSTLQSVLDVGAGDLRVKNKFLKAGFSGTYHTQDIGSEFEYTYQNLSQIQQTYDAILCLDVIEHMSLGEGMDLLATLHTLLNPGGVLILQTPNARCIRHPLSWDMTHVHCYNLPDLWALLTSEGYKVDGYRVVFQGDGGLRNRLYSLLGRFFITRFLGADYADNISLVAYKGAGK